MENSILTLKIWILICIYMYKHIRWKQTFACRSFKFMWPFERFGIMPCKIHNRLHNMYWEGQTVFVISSREVLRWLLPTKSELPASEHTPSLPNRDLEKSLRIDLTTQSLSTWIWKSKFWFGKFDFEFNIAISKSNLRNPRGWIGRNP